MEPTVWRHAKMNNCRIVSWGMDALTKTQLMFVCLCVQGTSTVQTQQAQIVHQARSPSTTFTVNNLRIT